MRTMLLYIISPPVKVFGVLLYAHCITYMYNTFQLHIHIAKGIIIIAFLKNDLPGRMNLRIFKAGSISTLKHELRSYVCTISEGAQIRASLDQRQWNH